MTNQLINVQKYQWKYASIFSAEGRKQAPYGLPEVILRKIALYEMTPHVWGRKTQRYQE